MIYGLKKPWYDKYIFCLILFMKYSDIYVVYFYPDSTEMSIFTITSWFKIEIQIIIVNIFWNLYEIFSRYLNKISLFHSLNCYEAT